jgi:hypothetical protein
LRLKREEDGDDVLDYEGERLFFGHEPDAFLIIDVVDMLERLSFRGGPIGLSPDAMNAEFSWFRRAVLVGSGFAAMYGRMQKAGTIAGHRIRVCLGA